ncbi:hypothetical protein F441_21858, partial [Phytophthora nicotianae CJ01A1]
VVVRLGALGRRRTCLSLLRSVLVLAPTERRRSTGLLVTLRDRAAGRLLGGGGRTAAGRGRRVGRGAGGLRNVSVDVHVALRVLAQRWGRTVAQHRRLAVGVALRPLADLHLVPAGLDPDVAQRGLVAPVLVHRHDGVARVHDVHVRNGHLLRLVAARAARPVELADVLAVEAVDVDGA